MWGFGFFWVLEKRGPLYYHVPRPRDPHLAPGIQYKLACQMEVPNEDPFLYWGAADCRAGIPDVGASGGSGRPYSHFKLRGISAIGRPNMGIYSSRGLRWRGFVFGRNTGIYQPLSRCPFSRLPQKRATPPGPLNMEIAMWRYGAGGL